MYIILNNTVELVSNFVVVSEWWFIRLLIELSHWFCCLRVHSYSFVFFSCCFGVLWTVCAYKRALKRSSVLGVVCRMLSAGTHAGRVFESFDIFEGTKPHIFGNPSNRPCNTDGRDHDPPCSRTTGPDHKLTALGSQGVSKFSKGM